MAAVLSIVGNTEAVAVNQAWAGMPGALVEHWVPSTPSTESTPATAHDLMSEPGAAAGLNVVQLWAKRLTKGAVAALLINASPHDLQPGSYRIEYEKLRMKTGNATVRSLWMQSEVGSFEEAYPIPHVPKFDSLFVIISPTS